MLIYGKINYTWNNVCKGINILIPKKRGIGFTKSPVYVGKNHITVFLNNLTCIDGFPSGVDCWGLDGYLFIKTGNRITDESRELIVLHLAGFLGLEKVKVDYDDFFEYVAAR